jgi:hypothetical protein
MQHFKQQPASQRTAAPQQAASGQGTSAQCAREPARARKEAEGHLGPIQ